MKTLGLCFVLLTFLLVPTAFGQGQPTKSTTSGSTAPYDDDVIAQLWNAHQDEVEATSFQGNNGVIYPDSDLRTCLYLRVYRVKREAKHSDVTVPSGYSTCVPSSRFEKKSSTEPKLH